MAVTLTRAASGPNMWTWTASGHTAGATLLWTVNGRLVQSGLGETLTWQARSNERLDVAVFEGTLGTIPASYPASVALEWEPVAGAEYYRVEEWVAGAWTTRARVVETGQWPARWDSGVLDDDAAWRFRVVAVDADGNDGLEREFEGWMCRAPDQAACDWVIDTEAGTITAE